MKGEKGLTVFIAAELAFILSFGAAGSMITGFGLTMERMAALAGICAFFSVFSALCFVRKRGGTVILCLLALLCGYLWHRGEAAEQILQMLQHISVVYDKAYGWGVLNFGIAPREGAPADLPMAIIAASVAIVTARTVCRQRSVFPAVGISLLPLLSCLVVTDTVPHVPYLFLLMTGLTVLILTGGVRRESAAQGNRLTALAAIPVTVAMAGLFLSVPQKSYVNQTKELQKTLLAWVEDFPQMLESTAQSTAMAFSNSEPEEVDLKSLGRRIPQSYPIMDVTAGESGRLYLRGQDYDIYSGTGWNTSPHRAEIFTLPEGEGSEVTVRTRTRKDIFYMPYYPAEETQLVAGRARNEAGEREYRFSCRTLPENWYALATAPPVYDGGIELTDGIYKEDWARYRNLPNATRTGARTIAGVLVNDVYSNTEKAEIIGEYVRNSAKYDLDTGRMPEEEDDFALWFLESADTGYCVHFATAAVILLRGADIPARYVSGYMVEAEAGKTVTVTAENAHAWAEYYEPRLDAWIVLEATPPEEEEAARPVIATLPPATEPEAPTVPAESETTAPTRETTVGPRPAGPSGPDFRVLKPVAVWMLSLAAAVLLVAGQRSARLALRKKKQRTGGNNARALARWQEAELLSGLLKQSPPEELLALAQKARFSQHTVTAGELARFDEYLRGCRRLLRQQPWYKKLVHQYIFAAY